MSTVKLIRYQMKDLSSAETNQVLTAPVSAVLAFVDGEGYPRQVPCWFLYEDERFFVTSIAGKFHVRKLEANPKASICVEYIFPDRPPEGPHERGHWQVKGIGDVRVYPEADSEVGARIMRKYLGDNPWPAISEQRVVIELSPRKLSAHGGGMQFEASSDVG